MLKQIGKFFLATPSKKAPAYRPVATPVPSRLIMTAESVIAMRETISREIDQGHEGIAYLLGLTNGTTTLVVGATRPYAQTTPGSFNVSSVAMARVVRTAADAGLQVVGQIHTHPGHAYHSGGDEEGARIAYDGYASIVIPDYGRLLPSLNGAAIYVFRAGGFTELGKRAVTVIDGRF